MLGTYLFIGHLVILLEAGLMIGGSIGAFLGGTEMIVSGILMVTIWSVLTALAIYSLQQTLPVFQDSSADSTAAVNWANYLFLWTGYISGLTGFGLGFLAFASCGPLYVPPYYHWVGFAGMVVLLSAYFILPAVVPGSEQESSPANHSWWYPLVLGVPTLIVWGVIWLALYLTLKGSINTSSYPKPGSSPYKLPYASGEDSWVIQGNNSNWDHSGRQAFAYDFRRRCGTPVIAARAGTFLDYVDSNDGHGGSSAPTNFVEIKHSDGTIGRYFHIQKGSVLAKFKDPKHPGKALPLPITQGETLALAGNVGNSLTGHIHFEVDSAPGMPSIPITFQDVTEDDGIPRTWSTYTSKNPK